MHVCAPVVTVSSVIYLTLWISAVHAGTCPNPPVVEFVCAATKLVSATTARTNDLYMLAGATITKVQCCFTRFRKRAVC